MGKRRGASGIVLEFGRGPDEGDDWEGSEEEDFSPTEDARPARDPQALIDGIDRNLQELRQALAEMG